MLYKKFNGDSNNEKTNSTPNENGSRGFWKQVLGINKIHNKDAEWLSNVKSELLNLEHEDDIITSKKNISKKCFKSSLTGKPQVKMDYSDTG